MGADALLRGLDETQRMAACHPDGPAAVIAGAGTGKTRVLIARVAWLIDSGRVAPEHVCALSFMKRLGQRDPRAPGKRAGPDRCREGHGEHRARVGQRDPALVRDDVRSRRALFDLGHERRGPRPRAARAHPWRCAERHGDPGAGGDGCPPAPVAVAGGPPGARRAPPGGDARRAGRL